MSTQFSNPEAEDITLLPLSTLTKEERDLLSRIGRKYHFNNMGYSSGFKKALMNAGIAAEDRQVLSILYSGLIQRATVNRTLQ